MSEQRGSVSPGVVAGGRADPATGDVPAEPAADLAPRLRRDSPGDAQQIPDVQPGNDPANLRATYVPDSAKPVHGSEFNPGGPEYTHQTPKGADDVPPTHGEKT